MRAFNACIRTRICLLAVAIATPFAVRAAGTVGVLAVAPPPGPSPELVELTVQLRQVMAERNPGVLEARQLRDLMAGQMPGASLEELDRAYEGARAAYVNGDFEGSVRTLRAIIEDLEKLPDSEETFKQWTRATMRLAKAELDLGHEDAARAAMERLVRSAPDVQVDRSLYPAKFARRIDDARAQLKAQPTHKLAVAASQPGVRVYVDGRGVGVAPVSLALARGRYKVSGALGTLRAPPLHVDLGEEDQRVLLDFAIPQALRPNQGPGIALPKGDRAGRLITAGGVLGLDSILAVSIAEDSGVSHLVGSLYDVRRGMLTREGRVRLSNKTVPVGGIHALADFLATGQPTPGVEVPGAPGLKPPETAAKPIDLRTPTVTATAKKSTGLGWVAFTTGIATVGLAGFGVAEALSASSSYDKAKKLRVNGNGPLIDQTTRSSYDQFISDGNSAKNKATIGYVGAGVGLVATGILGYLSYKQSGEIGPFRF